MTTVLICEDDAVLAADLTMSVEEAGHRVLGIYASAKDALEAAEVEVPDIAFIDLELADGYTGSGIAEALQVMGVKVIVLSGHPNVGAGLGTVPHTYAAKPLSSELVEFLLRSTADTKQDEPFADPQLATA